MVFAVRWLGRNGRPVVLDALATDSDLHQGGRPLADVLRQKRGERLIHTQALLALARRLVDVLWALLRDGRSFTPTAPPPATQAA